MLRYTQDLDGLSSAQIQGFFVGWPHPPDPEKHLTILRNSQHRILALDEKGGDVVGFICAISDGVLAAYITLLEVKPTYQGQGIGHALLRRMLNQLQGLYMIDLLCDPALVPFYEQHGFQAMQGMALRNHTPHASDHA